MKKERVSVTTNLTPNTEALKQSFATTGNLPSVETIEKAVALVTSHNEQKAPIERNQRKRETIKGTVLQAVMIDKDLLKKVKHKAYTDEISLSDVVNNCLKGYFQ